MNNTTMVLVPEDWLREISEKIDRLIEQQPAAEPEIVMNAEEAAKYLGITRNTAYTWAREKKLPARHVGSKVFFAKSELDVWMKRDQKEETE